MLMFFTFNVSFSLRVFHCLIIFLFTNIQSEHKWPLRYSICTLHANDRAVSISASNTDMITPWPSFSSSTPLFKTPILKIIYIFYILLANSALTEANKKVPNVLCSFTLITHSFPQSPFFSIYLQYLNKYSFILTIPYLVLDQKWI